MNSTHDTVSSSPASVYDQKCFRPLSSGSPLSVCNTAYGRYYEICNCAEKGKKKSPLGVLGKYLVFPEPSKMECDHWGDPWALTFHMELLLARRRPDYSGAPSYQNIRCT